MLKIRMQRTGRRNDPTFRVVVIESERGPKSGDFIEKLGFYEAKIGRKELNKERIQYWIGKGAQVSGTVYNFLIDEKIVDGKKINVLPKKTKQVNEKEGLNPAVAGLPEGANVGEKTSAESTTPAASVERTPVTEASQEPEAKEEVKA